MSEQFGLRELYEVSLKPTSTIEINGKTFEPFETIAIFDRIQVAILNEQVVNNTARGGYHNQERVWWRKTTELTLSFTQGVFNKQQFALMNNAKLLKLESGKVSIHKQERCEFIAPGVFRVPNKILTPAFFYDLGTGEKLSNWRAEYVQEDDKEYTILHVEENVTGVIADYYYNYSKESSAMLVGQQITNCAFILEGKTRVKDDIDGHTKTGIIRIPNLRLMSNLSMRLGTNAGPIVETFAARALPSGERGTEVTLEILFLQDDIDSAI